MKFGRWSAVVLVVMVLGSLGWGRSAAAQPKVTWKQVRWEGVILSIPEHYQFTNETEPKEGARATARFGYQPEGCAVVGACPETYGTLALYPNGGLNLLAWVERHGGSIAPSFDRFYGESVVADREAVSFEQLPDMFVSTTVAVPVGQEILVIDGYYQPEIIKRVQFAQPRAGQLKANALAWTRADWNLRTTAAGRGRVAERPMLAAGSLVTILVVQANAVQVRSSEGVTGWIQTGAARALTTVAPAQGWFDPFSTTATVRLAKGVPVREAPRSQAAQRGAVAPMHTTFVVGAVRGDWLLVTGGAVSTGWVRWRYDGAVYVARAE